MVRLMVPVTLPPSRDRMIEYAHALVATAVAIGSD
jgi:hypothetical protein